MKKLNVDTELKTLRGEVMMFDRDTRATFALVVESAISSDDKIDGMKSRFVAKRIVSKCVSGGEQTFDESEVKLICESVSRMYRPAAFFAVCDALGVEDV